MRAGEMRQHELEEWLRGSDDLGSAPADLAILGADTGSVTEAMARSIGFVLAVLRDIYADDAAVWRWLWRPRSELGYARAADLLLAGDGARIESLVTYQWNAAQAGGTLPSPPAATLQHAGGTCPSAWRP